MNLQLFDTGLLLFYFREDGLEFRVIAFLINAQQHHHEVLRQWRTAKRLPVASTTLIPALADFFRHKISSIKLNECCRVFPCPLTSEFLLLPLMIPQTPRLLTLSPSSSRESKRNNSLLSHQHSHSCIQQFFHEKVRELGQIRALNNIHVTFMINELFKAVSSTAIIDKS